VSIETSAAAHPRRSHFSLGMAKPINSIEEILLLRPGVSLEKLEAGPVDKLIKEFQRILGAGTLCEELDVLDLKGAERIKEGVTVHVSNALEMIDNRAGLDPETVSRFWPIFSHGDGHTFYYCPSRGRFTAHYHDPDILEDIGSSLSQAINAALDANFHFVPEDFSPVYWKPRSLFAMRFGAFGRRISPEQFLAATKGVPEADHVYCGTRRADLIWTQEYSHLHYVTVDGGDVGPIADARFFCFQPSQKTQDIMQSLRLLAKRLQLDIDYEHAEPSPAKRRRRKSRQKKR